MTSVSAGHIILTPTQPAGSGRPQRKEATEKDEQEGKERGREGVRKREKENNSQHIII